MSATSTSRSRPRDRKEQILRAAGQAFWSHGYHQVSMAEVAAAVGIGPSALYRHFRGKQELLVAVLHAQLDSRLAVADQARDAAALIERLADAAVSERELGALFVREAGHLPPQDSAPLRRKVTGLVRTMASTVPGPDARLRAWALLAVLDSPSFHHLDLPAGTGVLPDAAARAVSVPLAPPAVAPPAVALPQAGGVSGVAALVPVTRRERLLASALRLFAERGFPSVSLTDIGTAAGITGPSVYGYFPSKNDVLVAALQRGNEALWLGLDRTLSRTSDPEQALRGLVGSYIAFAVEHGPVLTVLLSEAVHLPEKSRQHFRQLQSDYVTEWTELLSRARPDLARADARLLVHASLSVVNTLTRVRALRSPALSGRCTALACAAMGLTADTVAS